MKNKGVAIRYGDVAPKAKENFVPFSNDSEFDTLSQLQQYNLDFPNYANPCELYSVVLDGKAIAFPSDPQSKNVGLVSKQISDVDGTFSDTVVLTLKSKGQYSSRGLTFTFDLQNNIYPTKMEIHWYRVVKGKETDLGSLYFMPNDAFYFCQNKVENYNKIEIKFYSINMPKNRLKLRIIDYGHGTIFYGDQLRNVNLIQEIDPISSQISINTVDFTIDSENGMDYSFQAKQPLSVLFNGELKATTFVSSVKRNSKTIWKIQSEDYIGLMNSIPYCGGIYTNKNAVELLTDIFTVAKVPYSIDDVFADKKVTGYIPFTTCRDALMQVAFAIQAVVDTSNSEVVKVFDLEEDVKQTIPLNRIMQGQNFADEEKVTGVEVAVHSYKPINETVDVYDATEKETGENIFVRFSEPLHDLSITNGDIIQIGTNYAVINAKANCVLSGQKYEHTTKIRRKNNPVVLASDIEKIVAIDNATLVSSQNIDNIIEKCYNWIVRTNSTNLKIVEGKHVQYGGYAKYGQHKYGTIKYGEKSENIVTYDIPVNVGENINAETEYLGTISGRLIKQSFNLNGNIIIKDAVMRDDIQQNKK